MQDQSGAVILDQGIYYKRAIEAVKYLKDFYEKALTPEVFAWNAASNNQALIAERSSFILNSISAYRSAQDTRPDIAKDIFFTPAPRGPSSICWANAHILYNYVVPQFAQANAPLAKAFIKHLVANYDRAIYQSKLYNSPSYFATPVPEGDRGYEPVSGAKTLQNLTAAWFDNDPFNMATPVTPIRPSARYSIPSSSRTWWLPSRAARTNRNPPSSERRHRPHAIFEKWRARGLV